MTKPVLVAGLLGGLLGGVGGFALTRAFPSAAKPPMVTESPQSHESRPLADDLIAKLKAGQHDEFFGRLRSGFVEENDGQFEKFREGVITARRNCVKAYGPAGDFEFIRETVISPSLVRFAYLEKYARGCAVCYVVLFDTAEGWRVLTFTYRPEDGAFGLVR